MKRKIMAEDRKKILIVISSDLYVRNYLLTDAFHGLELSFDCHYIANKDVTIRDTLNDKIGFKGFYQIEDNMKKLHQKIFDTLMFTFSVKSSSFRFRIKRQTPDLKRTISGPINRFHLRFLKWLVLKPYLIITRALLDNRTINNWYLKKLMEKAQPNNQLTAYLKKHDYSLIVFPSSAYDVEGTDIAWLCEKSNTNSLFLIDNWDNLSSKSILWKKPSFLGVWGEQSKQHAVKIQEFDESKIVLLGTPRFDNYFEARDRDLDSFFNYRYILFVGTALDFDEEAILALIDDVVEKNKNTWGDIKIIYRPHPWRQNNCAVKPSYGANIITDPQILAANNDKSTKTQPKLEYYSGLLGNAEYVMGGLTTMLIEGLIFHKQFLAFVHDDSQHITNMRNAWNNFEHFKGLDKVDAVSFSFNQNDIEETMLRCWHNREIIQKREIDQDRMWYLFDDGTKYQNRLLNMVSDIIF
jgi:hypothetical protein